MAIHLTAILKSKPDSIEALKFILLEMVQKATSEQGCLSYELFQNESDKSIFFFHEIWQNKNELDQHNQQVYIKDFFIKSKTILREPPLVYFNNKLS